MDIGDDFVKNLVGKLRETHDVGRKMDENIRAMEDKVAVASNIGADKIYPWS